MDIEVNIQYAVDAAGLPVAAQIEAWAYAALLGHAAQAVDELSSAELTVRIVGAAEGAELNQTYRQRSGPTNVLSFPFEAPPQIDQDYLGDLVICAPVVEQEARVQLKAHDAHWAHMVVHGCLHLLGYDHLDDEEAQMMETLEIHILAGLGYADPYLETDKV